MSLYIPWAISGSYFEVCNCEAICPCRQHGTRRGGRSSYGTCDFALSWRVILYVDVRGKAEQQQALSNIFLGQAGGTTLRNFARAIGEVYAVRPAQIALQHVHNQEHIAVEHYVAAKTAWPVLSDEIVTCGIPGMTALDRRSLLMHFRWMMVPYAGTLVADVGLRPRLPIALTSHKE